MKAPGQLPSLPRPKSGPEEQEIRGIVIYNEGKKCFI